MGTSSTLMMYLGYTPIATINKPDCITVSYNEEAYLLKNATTGNLNILFDGFATNYTDVLTNITYVIPDVVVSTIIKTNGYLL